MITIVAGEIALTRGDETEMAVAAPLDEEAFRAFYDRTSRSLWLYLARITGDRTLADDLLQETFYRFYRASAAHESELHRRNSLFRIATNLARDTHRRKRDVQHTPLEESESLLATRGDSLETRTDLERALGQLSSSQRELLWLAYAQGSSHDEIAEVVGVSRGSVKSLLFRARKKLAAILRAGEESR